MCGRSSPVSERVTLLIDGDLYLHRGTSAVEKEVRWDDENHMLFSNEEEAMVAVEYEIEKLVGRFNPERVVVCLSMPPLFRTEIDPTYKSNRAGVRKPVAYTACRERLEANYNVVKFPSLEADDVMGILATRNDNAVICSMDKDMQQIPGRVWNHKELRFVSLDDADRWFMTQTLIGDTSDGYKGCPGIGPAKAEKLLNEAFQAAGVNGTDFMTEAWARIVKAYQKVRLTEGDALRQARLARILRADDWDFKKKEVKLWRPPTLSTTPEAKP